MAVRPVRVKYGQDLTSTRVIAPGGAKMALFNLVFTEALFSFSVLTKLVYSSQHWNHNNEILTIFNNATYVSDLWA